MKLKNSESKGMVESTVGYVKKNAIKGRDDELQTWNDYGYLANHWRDNVANVRVHHRLKEKPIDRFIIERPLLRPVLNVELNTDEIAITEVRPTARIEFDTNRYTVPPELARKTVTIQASTKHIRIFHQGALVACHERCYGRRELIAENKLRTINKLRFDETQRAL